MVNCPYCHILLPWPTQQQNVPLDKNQNMIPASIDNSLPSVVRDQLSKLPVAKQQEFIEEFNRKHKSIGCAYCLWVLLGWHYAYLGKWGYQALFILSLGGFFIWWLIDIFRIPSMVRDYNKDIAINIIRDQQLISGH